MKEGVKGGGDSVKTEEAREDRDRRSHTKWNKLPMEFFKWCGVPMHLMLPCTYLLEEE